ncbi:hypothetical protein LZK98_11850 [Sphingomonas cannabina]|uniref:hypothetical protein n=1 Tax=Sphingomonas cannabina TaxID=2899123 RepID=UPI001F248028|nr:hypothetical protein [Sphingomonas cannabina]UIJ43785.1 hypothetical protein LZK98_11850 [Sphingomonas cannabina]
MTNTAGGIPVTLTGGTTAAIADGQEAEIEIDGTPTTVTFTVVSGQITGITTA